MTGSRDLMARNISFFVYNYRQPALVLPERLYECLKLFVERLSYDDTQTNAQQPLEKVTKQGFVGFFPKDSKSFANTGVDDKKC